MSEEEKIAAKVARRLRGDRIIITLDPASIANAPHDEMLRLWHETGNLVYVGGDPKGQVKFIPYDGAN